MKKAIFVGYKQKGHSFNFTIGKKYIVKQKFGYEHVTDDDGHDIPLIPHSDVYEFLITNEENFIKEPAILNFSVDEPANLKYFINGNIVTKQYFYESLGELNEAERLGASISSVNFEIKFE